MVPDSIISVYTIKTHKWGSMFSSVFISIVFFWDDPLWDILAIAWARESCISIVKRYRRGHRLSIDKTAFIGLKYSGWSGHPRAPALDNGFRQCCYLLHNRSMWEVWATAGVQFRPSFHCRSEVVVFLKGKEVTQNLKSEGPRYPLWIIHPHSVPPFSYTDP